MIKKIANKISSTTRIISRVLLSLIGVNKITKYKWDYSNALVAAWTFVLGMPVAAIFSFGMINSLPVWFSTILIILMITNLDKSLILMSILMENGSEYIPTIK